MSFSRLNAGMTQGGKYGSLSPEAGWLAICGLDFVALHLTDGWIPVKKLPLLSTETRRQLTRALQELNQVTSGNSHAIWHEPGFTCDSRHCPAFNPRDAWAIHDYLDPEYGQPTSWGLAKLKESGRQGGLTKAKRASERLAGARQSLEGVLDDRQEIPASERLANVYPVTVTVTEGINPPSPPLADRLPRDPELDALQVGWYELSGRQPNQADEESCARALARFHRFHHDAATILARIKPKAEERLAANKEMVPFAYWEKFLERQHDEMVDDQGDVNMAGVRRRSKLDNFQKVGEVVG